MESLPENPILEYNKTTLQDVRKKYDLDKPERLKESLDIIAKWVKEQKHFTNKEYSPRYLENTLIPCKGSLERSKMRIDKMCTFRSLLPQYFGEYDLREDFKDIHEGIQWAYLPKLTPDHNRILLAKVSGNRWYSNFMLQITRLGIIQAEYLKEHESADAYIAIIDYRELDNILEHVRHVNPVDLKNGLAIIMEGMGVRVRGIHLITSSKYIEVIVNLFKSVLSAKLGGRIQVHNSLETVYDCVPKDVIPKEYGGQERTLKELQEKWIEVLSSEESMEHLRKMNESRTDESLREADIFNKEYMGMPGSFRTLSVD
ncbi:CRAL/TRIO domain-containing protein [Phthorimaea operculella]|nr:CRAL/TRIO domain-containing protein [Phthorimaea operculella]